MWRPQAFSHGEDSWPLERDPKSDSRSRFFGFVAFSAANRRPLRRKKLLVVPALRLGDQEIAKDLNARN
jgi:hypothetical protein